MFYKTATPKKRQVRAVTLFTYSKVCSFILARRLLTADSPPVLHMQGPPFPEATVRSFLQQ